MDDFAALDPGAVLQGAARPLPRVAPAPQRLLVAGAGGPLGRALLHAALGAGRYAEVGVLTCAPLRTGTRGLRAVPHDAAAAPAADVALVVFDRGRDHYGRDEAYHLPEPQQLPAFARRLRAGGVHTLAVVCPTAPALLPMALQHGLANLDEQAVAALGFERLLFVRPTQDALGDPAPAGRLPRLARWMLAQLRYMIPRQERPVRPESVAAFVLEVLRQWPEAAPGTRVAGAALVWAAAQPDGPQPVVRQWLHGDG